VGPRRCRARDVCFDPLRVLARASWRPARALGRWRRPRSKAAAAGRRSPAARIGSAGLHRVCNRVIAVIAAGLIDASGRARLVHADGAQKSLPDVAIMARAEPPPGSPIEVRQHDEAGRGGHRSSLPRCRTGPAAPVGMPASDGSRLQGAATRVQPRSDPVAWQSRAGQRILTRV
jgi:hypothetical protein